MKQSYVNKIKNGAVPKILITVLDGNIFRDSLRHNYHPAEIAGAHRFSVEYVEVPNRGKKLPFTGMLLNYPVLSKAISPLERSAPNDRLELQVSGMSGISTSDIDNGGMSNLIMRADVYIDGMDLSEVDCWMIGRINQISYNAYTGSISMSAEDGEYIGNTEYPSGSLALDASLFGQMPASISGRFKRRVILGVVTYPILCPQIDDSRKRFYVSDDKATLVSNQDLYVGTSSGKITNTYRVKHIEFPNNRVSASGLSREMTIIEFDEALDLELPYLLINNVSGISPGSNPVDALLFRYGNYIPTERTKTIVKNLDLSLSLLNQVKADVYSIFKDRIADQIGYFPGFSGGKIQLYEVGGIDTGIYINDTNGIIDLSSDSFHETPEDLVVNAIEIGWQRNIFSETDLDSAKYTYILDKNNAEGDLARKLQSSEARFGRKYLNIPMPDIQSNSTQIPDIVKRMARSVLRNNYRQRKVYDFLVYKDIGFRLQLNQKVDFAFSKLKIGRTRARIVSKKLLPYCMSIGLMIED